MGSARLEIVKTLGYSRVDDTALLRSVFVKSGRELRVVDRDFGCQNDPTARKDGLDKIAVSDAGLGSHAVRNGDLALPLNLDDGRHRDLGKPRLPASARKYSRLSNSFSAASSYSMALPSCGGLSWLSVTRCDEKGGRATFSFCPTHRPANCRRLCPVGSSPGFALFPRRALSRRAGTPDWRPSPRFERARPRRSSAPSIARAAPPVCSVAPILKSNAWLELTVPPLEAVHVGRTGGENPAGSRRSLEWRAQR